MPATISVVVTCHNYGRFLGECLESILAQERRPGEIVVVDDASTDETPTVAAAYAAHGVRYERVDFRDACRSYNHGVAISGGELLAFADADNALAPGFIATLAAPLEADPALGFAYSDRYSLDETAGAGAAGATLKGAEIARKGAEIARSYPPDPAMLVHENFIDTMCMVRRAAFEAVGGFRSMPAIWDYRLWVSILEAGWAARYVPEPLFYYRLHGANMILRERPRLRGCALLIRREHFSRPFWADYTHPDLTLEAQVLPAASVPGANLCRVALTPVARGAAYPRSLTLRATLPPGSILLDHSRAAPHHPVVGGGDARGVELDIYYPIPDGGAAAAAPTIWLTLAIQEATPGAALAVELAWQDLFEEPHRHSARVPLPDLPVAPPLRQAIVPGWQQRVIGPFTPGEEVNVWAALPVGAAVPSLPMPRVPADARGGVSVDLRFAPRDFAAVVLQGGRSAVQAVLVPAGAAGRPAPEHRRWARLPLAVRRRLA